MPAKWTEDERESQLAAIRSNTERLAAIRARAQAAGIETYVNETDSVLVIWQGRIPRCGPICEARLKPAEGMDSDDSYSTTFWGCRMCQLEWQGTRKTYFD